MEIRVTGRYAGPVIALVGTWDPMSPAGRTLLGRLAAAGRARGIGSAAILLDPPPRIFLEGPAAYPLFHDLARREELVRESGVDLVARVDFSADDLYATAADFFAAVCPHLVIEEFWLRDGQDLGRNARGSRLAVAVACRSRRIRFEVLPPEAPVGDPARARGCLLRGEVGAATELAGCRPSLRRPIGNVLRLAWPAGAYTALDPRCRRRGVIEIELVPDGELRRLTWPPGGPEAIEILRGPGDETTTVPRRAADVAARARRETLIREIFHASSSPR